MNYTEKTVKAGELFKDYDFYVDYVERGWANITRANEAIERDVINLGLSKEEYVALFDLVHEIQGYNKYDKFITNVFKKKFDIEIEEEE